MTTESNEREALSNRVLPQMKLSGSKCAVTAPPEPLSTSLSTVEIAARRFAVKGNAAFTGGTGNLALACARALLEHGLSGLALLDLTATDAHPEILALRASFPSSKIITKVVNVTDKAQLDQVMGNVAKELGGIDILACFAGIVQCTHAEDMSENEWRRVIDVNLTGSWFAAQAAGRHMIDQGRGGRILFIASISAHRVNFPQPQVSYNVSKSALLHLKNSLAAEWAGYGIRVNSISPGYMDTILNEGPGLADARRSWEERNPMGRMGCPDELTGPVVFLCSGFAGSYVNGADVVVDGGGIVF